MKQVRKAPKPLVYLTKSQAETDAVCHVAEQSGCLYDIEERIGRDKRGHKVSIFSFGSAERANIELAMRMGLDGPKPRPEW